MPRRSISMETYMRLISITILLALLSSAALAQQSPPTVGETIGHPAPIPGPPTIAEPSSTMKPGPAVSTPQASEPAPKGYTGAYGPPGPATLYSTGPLPVIDTGTGRIIVEPDGSTKTVKAAPCGKAARETDGVTTCVGIPDESARATKNR
jgi:hypothetical protein